MLALPPLDKYLHIVVGRVTSTLDSKSTKLLLVWCIDQIQIAVLTSLGTCNQREVQSSCTKRLSKYEVEQFRFCNRNMECEDLGEGFWCVCVCACVCAHVCVLACMCVCVCRKGPVSNMCEVVDRKLDLIVKELQQKRVSVDQMKDSQLEDCCGQIKSN